ncbi:monooxygenase [Escherichia coli]|uniref:monooxygenase n=5 Tax=Escherichia coli TaxID=562 RepID=UPI00050A7C66|nr:monooxygenase [Escherichia coli]KYS00269.1 monooxygenase [Escherichia coli]
MTDFGGKTSIFSHPVYLFLREFSLQDFRGGSINQEPGFLWKVWTESEKNHEAGGIYLFTDEKSALAYLEKHTARLKNLGVEEVVAKVFDVNEPLSQINQAKLA